MARNLVLCIDGTNDFAARYPTHVYRLFRTLERSDAQLIYYDGGVGTLIDPRAHVRLLGKISQSIDLAAGFSIRDNFINAYNFLCDYYEEKDEIYLFGFSRGSYTIRAIAAAVHYYGIPRPENKNLIPYIWQQFSTCGEIDDGNAAADNPFRVMNRLKGALTEKDSCRRKPMIKFLGAWDTVSSFGLVNLRALPGTSKLHCVEVVRHAVSIDERRNMFPENLVAPKTTDSREVWFAGVHRDVGGGGGANKRGLSMCAYQWLTFEAESQGLRIDPDKINKKNLIPADAIGPDNSDFWTSVFYKAIGIIPMKMWEDKPKSPDLPIKAATSEESAPKEPTTGEFQWKWFNFVHVRPIPDGALVHKSVKEREDQTDYNPRNLRAAKDIQYVGDLKLADAPVAAALKAPKSKPYPPEGAVPEAVEKSEVRSPAPDEAGPSLPPQPSPPSEPPS